MGTKDKEVLDEVRNLKAYFCRCPEGASVIVERKVAKELILSSEGWTIRHGSIYNYKVKSVPPGLCEISVEKKYK